MSNTITNPSPPKIGVDARVNARYMPDIRIHTTNGPFKPMLAKVYELGVTRLRWPVIVQPKYDGVRALWDGECVRSRSGKDSLVVPRDILDVLEREFKGISLDGELYAHGVGFEAIVSAARNRKNMQDSGTYDVPGTVEVPPARLQYVVFDMPTSEGFEDRVRHLEGMFTTATLSPLTRIQKYDRVVLSSWMQVRTHQEFLMHMQMWTADGYEGIMIRALGAGYEERRTAQLLKWKRTRTARAIVMGIVPGKGKHEGRMGALWVRGEATPWVCKVGTGFTDVERERGGAEWLGATVTIAFQEFSVYNTPRFPRFVGLASKGEELP